MVMCNRMEPERLPRRMFYGTSSRVASYGVRWMMLETALISWDGVPEPKIERNGGGWSRRPGSFQDCSAPEERKKEIYNE